MSKHPQDLTEDDPLILYKTDGPIDTNFLNDLDAANRFKAFLVGRGVDISSDILLGLGTLTTTFKIELDEYNDYLIVDKKIKEF